MRIERFIIDCKVNPPPPEMFYVRKLVLFCQRIKCGVMVQLNNQRSGSFEYHMLNALPLNDR